MRTTVDIPDEQLRKLDALARSKGITRAESVRRAIDAFLAADFAERDRAFREAFGAWKHLNITTDEYLRELRVEWDR
jgi:metal-responsive CopG/Arc/MetJ family transcriptional regulator